MPRMPRPDIPGLPVHVMARGIEKRDIYSDEHDRRAFLERLGRVIVETQTPILAFALMPNHFHLLLQRGAHPVASVMRRILTGYAVYFNKRHKRVGHLFQNRYKSIMCDDEVYLRQLIRYISINPVRTGIVPSVYELATYPYTGHAYMLGRVHAKWFDAEAVLPLFGSTLESAQASYEHYICDGLLPGKIGSQRGVGDDNSNTINIHDGLRTGERGSVVEVDCVDGAICVGGEIPSSFSSNDARNKRNNGDNRSGHELDLAAVLLDKLAGLYGIKIDEITGRSRAREVVEVRALFACLAYDIIGMPQAGIAKSLNVNRSAVARMMQRGHKARNRLDDELEAVLVGHILKKY